MHTHTHTRTHTHTNAHTHTHTQVIAREGEAQELMGKLASKESEVVKLQAAKDEQQRQSTQLIERLHKDVALWQATVKSVAAAGAAGTVMSVLPVWVLACCTAMRVCLCGTGLLPRAWGGCCAVWQHMRIRVAADALPVWVRAHALATRRAHTRGTRAQVEQMASVHRAGLESAAAAAGSVRAAESSSVAGAAASTSALAAGGEGRVLWGMCVL